MSGDYHLDRGLREARLREAAERRHQHELRRRVRAARRRERTGAWRARRFWPTRRETARARPRLLARWRPSVSRR